MSRGAIPKDWRGFPNGRLLNSPISRSEGLAMQWMVPAAILVAAMFIAISIRDVGRWQISSDPEMDSPFHVYRLDRWNGEIQYCGLDTSQDPRTTTSIHIVCPAPLR